MATRPPRFLHAARPHDRIAGAVLPWTVYRQRTRNNDHVAGWRTSCSADRADDVEPFASSQELGSFERIRFRDPLVGIAPPVIHLLHRPRCRKAIRCKRYSIDAGEEQIASIVFANDVARIDQPFDAEIDRRAPRTLHVGGMNDVDVGEALESCGPGRAHERDVDVVAPGVLHEINGEDRAERASGVPDGGRASSLDRANAR